jgi:hypothetical protein
VLEQASMQPGANLHIVLEVDHRNQIPTKIMLGIKLFSSAATTILGIELMHRIRKGQFNVATLDLKDTLIPIVSNAVIST